MTVIEGILSFLLQNWTAVAAVIAGAGGIKGIEALLRRWRDWLESRAKAAEAQAQMDAARIKSYIDTAVKAAVNDVRK